MRTKKPRTRTDRRDAARKPAEANPWNDTLTIGPTDRLTYRRFQTEHRRFLDPRDPHETILAEAIITHRWFLRLADLAEIAVLRDAVHQDQSPPITMRDLLCPESGELKSALAECNAPASPADRTDRCLAVAFDRVDLDKIHKFRKEHERALDRLTKEWSVHRRSQPNTDEEVP